MDDLWPLLLAAVPLLLLWIAALVEVGRRSDLATGRRIGWAVVLLLVPVVGLAIYVILRPAPRPTTSVGSGRGTTAELAVTAAERHQRGELDDDAYRAEILGLVG